MKRQHIDQLVIGFALFSMFFGAGNIIFPPFIGMEAGSQWFPAFLCYYMADIGLSLVTIFALIRNDGDLQNITGRIGTIPGEVMISAIILCIGPFIALPRTGATVHEMFVVPAFGSVSPAVTTSVFFVIILLLTLREASVVDIIGKILTPALFLGLMILIVSGFVSPIGKMADSPAIDNVITEGIYSGYQTMDVLAAIIFGIIIVKNVHDKGYTEADLKYRITRNSSMIAAAALLVVYGGLTYLGATVSSIYTPSINRSDLIINITNSLMSRSGVIILGIIVTLACITTAVALVSASADYFSNISHGKLDYKLLVVLICIVSALIGNFGIDKIVLLASPALTLIYPGALTLVLLSLLKDRISDFTVKCAVIGAMFGSLCEIAYGYGLDIPFILHMPLHSYGLGWFTFALAAALISIPLRKLVKKHGR